MNGDSKQKSGMRNNTAKGGWKDISRGGVILEPGNAESYQTGSWRTKKPLWSKEKCIQCLLCWIYCPDLSINLQEGKVSGVDYDHCKGCGICAHQCPAGALEMIAEDESDIEEKDQDDIQQSDIYEKKDDN
ncbi:MAG TPA: 4Fe-4S binding protein [Halanaerobiales bacterium]|nr:4Fe-4S binding protein [Halanaerobiales bacterium]